MTFPAYLTLARVVYFSQVAVKIPQTSGVQLARVLFIEDKTTCQVGGVPEWGPKKVSNGQWISGRQAWLRMAPTDQWRI